MPTPTPITTRIKNRIDTYANWSTYNPELLAGEIALVSITETKKDANGNVVQVPAVLMKVGAYKKDAQGNDTTTLCKFNELPWASAKSADVYDWAKLEHPADISVTVPVGDGATRQMPLSDWLEEFYFDIDDNSDRLDVIEGLLDMSTDNTVVEEIDAKINTALKDINTATTGSVATTDGVVTGFTWNATTKKLTATRKALPTASSEVAGITKVGVTGGAASHDAVFGTTGLKKTVDDLSDEVDRLADLALITVRYEGIAAEEPTDNSVAMQSGKTLAPTTGSLVIYDGKEYVYNGTQWEELGNATDLGTLKEDFDKMVVTDADATNQGAGASKFVTKVTQTKGKITASYAQPVASDILYQTGGNTVYNVVEDLSDLVDNATDALAGIDTDNNETVLSKISDAINALEYTGPAAPSSADDTADAFVTTVTQDNGTIRATKKYLPSASTSVKGIVKLAASIAGNSTTEVVTAAQANVVKELAEDNADRLDAVEGDYIRFNSNKLYVGKSGTAEIIFDCGGANIT